MRVNPRGKMHRESTRSNKQDVFQDYGGLRVRHAKEHETLKISKKTYKRLKDPGDKKENNLRIHVEKGRGNPRIETNQMLLKLRWTMRQTRVRTGNSKKWQE